MAGAMEGEILETLIWILASYINATLQYKVSTGRIGTLEHIAVAREYSL
jgi:hypothetical protein